MYGIISLPEATWYDKNFYLIGHYYNIYSITDVGSDIDPLKTGKPLTGTQSNSEDPDAIDATEAIRNKKSALKTLGPARDHVTYHIYLEVIL